MGKVHGPMTEGEEKGFSRKGIRTFPTEVVQVDPREMERWKNEHANDVYDAIKEIDRRDARSQAQAPFIAISNAADGNQ